MPSAADFTSTRTSPHTPTYVPISSFLLRIRCHRAPFATSSLMCECTYLWSEQQITALITRGSIEPSMPSIGIKPMKDPIPPEVFTAILKSMDHQPHTNIAWAAYLLLYYGALQQSEITSRTIASWDANIHSTRGDFAIRDDCCTLLNMAKTSRKPASTDRFEWQLPPTLTCAQSRQCAWSCLKHRLFLNTNHYSCFPLRKNQSPPPSWHAYYC